jgi:hypothetical protein
VADREHVGEPKRLHDGREYLKTRSVTRAGLRHPHLLVAGDRDRIQAYPMEMVRLDPDVIVTNSGMTTRTMQERHPTLPTVFPMALKAGAAAELCLTDARHQ